MIDQPTLSQDSSNNIAKTSSRRHTSSAQQTGSIQKVVSIRGWAPPTIRVSIGYAIGSGTYSLAHAQFESATKA